ncbi:ABC transporter ATP-binding protein [Geitlerinema sp. PCC 9228]|jgi:iron complex transport system ATP-binding protein|uniref:ABC transporter ATP-binding protein n=1 Tax=Geitlerinema sp. PCC 9228 TaxID=111611 RepID=UPI0008F9BC7D|nr:ABC transporter ATP-binding protein [Geitlerinema sp. PCC 9228]
MDRNAPTYRLTAQNLSLGYEKNPIVVDLSLAVPAQAISVLVGPNGCGKSTLLRGLARLLKPTHGVVYLDGNDIRQLPTKGVAKRLGILPQNPSTPAGLTVKELVAQGRYPYQNWLQQWSREDETMVEQAMQTARIQEFAHRPIETLSGGQQQRAWVATVLAQDTDILLLDEPTTYLDIARQIELLDLLRQLNQEQKRTIVMVLHDLNQACRYADFLMAVKDGQLRACGSPQEVMTESIVREVFDLECRIVPDPVTDTPMCVPVSPCPTGDRTK